MRQNARRVDVEDEFGEDIVAFGSLQLNRTRRILSRGGRPIAVVEGGRLCARGAVEKGAARGGADSQCAHNVTGRGYRFVPPVGPRSVTYEAPSVQNYGGWWREASPCCFGNAEKSGRRNFTPVYASLPHAPHTNVLREPSRIGKHFIEVRS